MYHILQGKFIGTAFMKNMYKSDTNPLITNGITTTRQSITNHGHSLLEILYQSGWVCNFLWCHDDVIKWKHFPGHCPFVRGIHRSPVNSPHKGQWRWALMFSLICVWINDWVNNREAGDLRRYRDHYDVIVMWFQGSLSPRVHELVIEILWSFRRCNYYFDYSIRSKTCTCHGSWNVVTFAKFRPDLIIILKWRASWTFLKIGLCALLPFFEMVLTAQGRTRNETRNQC